MCIPPAQDCTQKYYTASGDSCSSVDKKYNLVDGTIKKANNFVNCNDIWSGTELCIPDGPYKQSNCKQTYLSAKGDTCFGIEQDFHLVHGTIKQANDFLEYVSRS